MESEQLDYAPCPHCGSTDEPSPVLNPGRTSGGKMICAAAIECSDCFARGPVVYDLQPNKAIAYAVRAWNRRTGESDGSRD